MQSSLCVPSMIQNHIILVNLIKLPKDSEKCQHLLVQATFDRIEKGILVNGKTGLTQNAALTEENLIADI